MKIYEDCKVISNVEILKDIFDLRLESSLNALPGQFVNVYLGLGEHILPRPISVCEVSSGVLRLVFRVVGKGTEHISKVSSGEKVRIMGALGNGFNVDLFSNGSVAVIGGGIGIPPLLELVKQIKTNNPNSEIHAFLGFRSQPFMVDDFEKYCIMHIATDDGSVGFWGTAVNDLRNSCIKINAAAACGPMPMLKAASEWANDTGSRLFVSTEERMACGIGACVGCAIKINNGKDFIYKKVCVDGPVFESLEVVWH